MGQQLTDKEKGRLDDQLLEVRRLAAQGDLPYGPVRRALQAIAEGRFQETPVAAQFGRIALDSRDPNRLRPISKFTEELGVRIINTLERELFRTLGDIADVTEKEFGKLPQVGINTTLDLRGLLIRHGLRFSYEGEHQQPSEWHIRHGWASKPLEYLGLSPVVLRVLKRGSYYRQDKLVYTLLLSEEAQIRRNLRDGGIESEKLDDTMDEIKDKLAAKGLSVLPSPTTAAEPTL